MTRYLSLDTETTGLPLFHNSAPFMAWTLSDQEVYRGWEWPVDPFSREVLPSYDQRKSLCGYLAGTGDTELVFHHADFDIRALAKIGIRICIPGWEAPRLDVDRKFPEMKVYVKAIHDTQILSHVVNSQGTGDKESEFGRHALKPLALHYLDIPEGDESDLRKATVSARRIGKKLGWKLGASLDGESEVEADYWMPNAVVQHYLNHEELFHSTPDDDPIFTWANLCETYCKGDVYRTLGLFFFFQEMLEQEPALKEQYAYEMRLMPVLHMTEHVGLYCNRERAVAFQKALETDAENYKVEAEEILCKASGRKELNVNSGPLQLAPTLIECGLPLTKRTKPSKKFPKGQWATDAKVLRDLAQFTESKGPDNAPRPPRIQQAGYALRLMVGYNPDDGDDCESAIPGFKTFQTGASYVAGYIRSLDPLERIHSSYHQVGTAWTRLSCREPNNQNVSKKAVLPLRRLFGPPPGYVWFAVDYSQLEARIYATASNNEILLKAFDDGYDFHTATAIAIYDLPPEQITSERRRVAKAVNFGILFGAGPAKVDATTGKPGTYQYYMDKFPDTKTFMRKVSTEVERTGFVYTLTGYKLRVPDEKPYAGVNAIVQGTAGIIVKRAMVDLHESGLVDWAPPSRELPYGGSAIVANIHDELVFQVPKSYPYKALGRKYVEVMEHAGSYAGVKTPCDAKIIETNWAEGKKFE